LRASKVIRIFGFPDFRLFWIGAFVSFTGSWIQKVAESYFVYEITHDESKLAFVMFCNSLPVFLFGFVSGWLADAMDKRMVLIVTQAIYALGAIFLAVATQFHFVQYWHIVVVALVLGLVGCVEMPTRQSVVSRVVPAEDIAVAVPVNAMTFNAARILGPAIGGWVLTRMGVPACYLLNGLSFVALIWAVKAIKANLAVLERKSQPVLDLILEGARYTMREPRLRTLLILETITATFGLCYITLVPAYVDQVLNLGTDTGAHPDAAKIAISHCYTAIGIGALIGLVFITAVSDAPYKRLILRVAMLLIGFGSIGMSAAHNPWFAYFLMGILGGSTVVQFNSTNSLFQLLSPDRLRGRVLAMHIWALNGLAPFGVLAAGWLASTTRQAAELHPHAAHFPLNGVRLALFVGGMCVLGGAVVAMLSNEGLSGLEDPLVEEPEPSLA